MALRPSVLTSAPSIAEGGYSPVTGATIPAAARATQIARHRPTHATARRMHRLTASGGDHTGQRPGAGLSAGTVEAESRPRPTPLPENQVLFPKRTGSFRKGSVDDKRADSLNIKGLSRRIRRR